MSILSNFMFLVWFYIYMLYGNMINITVIGYPTMLLRFSLWMSSHRQNSLLLSNWISYGGVMETNKETAYALTHLRHAVHTALEIDYSINYVLYHIGKHRSKWLLYQLIFMSCEERLMNYSYWR